VRRAFGRVETFPGPQRHGIVGLYVRAINYGKSFTNSEIFIIMCARDLFACLNAPSPSDPVPRNAAMDVTIPSSRVAARQRHAAGKPGGSATFAEQE
jgi:hypothetical protein